MAGSAEHHAVERGTDAHVFAHRARAVGLFEQLSCTFGAEQLTAYSDTNLQKSMLHAACKNGGAHPCMQTLRVDCIARRGRQIIVTKVGRGARGIVVGDAAKCAAARDWAHRANGRLGAARERIGLVPYEITA